MNYYNVLPTRNIGGNLAILTFSCQELLEIGQIVEIEIRNSQDYGLVISQNTEYNKESAGESILKIETQKNHVSNNISNLKINSTEEESNSKKKSAEKSVVSKNKNDFEIKEIIKKFPFIISKQQIEFLQSFTTNTFNSPNDIWSSIFQPFKLLTQKQIKELEENIHQNSKKMTYINSKLEEFGDNVSNSSTENKTVVKKTPIIDFILDSDILIRIIYIIRSLIHSDTNEIEPLSNQTLLIVFPEKKYLDIVLNQLQNMIKKENFYSKIDTQKYTGEINKNSKETIWSMISNNKPSQIQIKIIFTTRSGIFLPFSNLSQIILVDEGNSLYIQDQNSLYFDTRDAIFLLHKAFLSNLTFVSTLPSLRLRNFYKMEDSNNYLTSGVGYYKSPLKLKISTLDTKSAKFGLFGWGVEQILKKDEESYN